MLETPAPELARHTTLRLGGKAVALLDLERKDDLDLLPEKIKSLGGKPWPMGRCSNILAASGNLPVVLVRPKGFQRLEIVGNSDDKIFVAVGAGVPLPRLLRFCLAHGLSGLEGLAGVPGHVGGACAMNAGSFGTEIGRCAHEVLAFAKNTIKSYKNKDLIWKYRKLDFAEEKEKPLVLEVIFTLTAAVKSVIFKAINLNFFEKKTRQPLDAWSAGCAFKNPENNMPAGRLLELAGFRGKKLGGMAFSSRHANFLINEGNGSPQAAFDLLEQAKSAVYEKFGVTLEPEIRIIK